MNKITYVRDGDGHFVRKAFDKTVDVISEVVRVYAEIFHGILTLGIKVGLFVLLWPQMYKFFIIFIDSIQKAVG